MSGRRRGQTLLELVVVLAIVALSLAAVVPAMAAWRAPRDAEEARQVLRGALERARTRAVAGGTATTLVVEPSTGRAWLHPGDTTFLLAVPDGCRLAGSERTAVRFAPDGRARGVPPGAACGRDVVTLRVDALSGEIRAVASGEGR